MAVTLVKIPVVVGTGECVVTKAVDLFLNEKATELKRVTKTTTITNFRVGAGEVLLDGIIHKNVEYETEEHVVGSDKFDVPFECCIPIPGAAAGDDVEIEVAEVTLEKDELVPCPPTKKVFEKVCVHVVIKVLRPTQLNVVVV